MPKRRDQIQMSEGEIWDFIGSQKTAQFATIERDGTPNVVPLWFAIVDGDIVFETFTKSQKVKNLERDPRVTVLFEDGDTYEKLRAVQIRGRCELHKDVDTVHRLHTEVLRRNTPEIPVDAIEKISRGMAPKKTAIVVKAERFVSWDHAKLGGVY